MSLLLLGLATALAAPDRFSTFALGEGRGWVARLDPTEGTATRAFGPPISLGRLGGERDLVAALDDFIERNPRLFGVVPSDLVLRSAAYLARNDTWYVDYARQWQGHPVWSAGATFRVRGGKIVMIGVDTVPSLRVVETVPGGAVILPRDGGYRLARVLRRDTISPPGRWTVLVDSQTGEELYATNAVRFLDGVLSAEHDTRNAESGTTTSPLRFATLESASGATVVTGSDGSFSIDEAESWTAYLEGPYVRVTNEGGDEGQLAVLDDSPLFDSIAATQAEIDSFVYLHQVRDWAQLFSPGLAFLDTQVRSKVNASVTCYAYWDGAVNFGIEGDGCGNAGQIADSNYHEWGHGFHENSVLSGTVDGTIGEAAGDLVAVMQTLDSAIAPGFYDDGDPIRDLTTFRYYPEDIRDNVYQDSIIYSGAAWDLLVELQSLYGESASEKGSAWEISSRLLVDSLAGGPTIETIFDEYMLADDDNANLADGTPHLCLIVDTFGNHGLGPAVVSFPATVAHAPIENQPADTDIAVIANVRSLAPGCIELDLGAVRVSWTTDGEDWTDTPLALADGIASGALPGQPNGTVIHYAIIAVAGDGDELRFPAVGAHSFYVGALEESWCEDFSASDGGFTHAALSGSGSSADDWAFGAPIGMSGDPYGAYTGETAWGNDFDRDGAYPYEVVNRLYSLPLEVDTGGPIVVQFRRWLTLDVEGGDHARVYVNEAEAWTTEVAADEDWIQATLVVSPASSPVTLSWELESDDNDSAGGWTIDDACVYRTTLDTPVDTGDTAGAIDTGDSADDTDSGGRDTSVREDTATPPGDEPCSCRDGSAVGALLLLGLRRRR